MRVCLFEDQSATLEPLSLTRPLFDLRCGITTLAEKHLRLFRPWSVGALIRPHLAPLYQRQHPDRRVNDLSWLREDTTLLVNGRWLPAAKSEAALAGPAVALAGDEIAYALLAREQLRALSADNLGDCLENWKATLPSVPVGGSVVHYPWDLVDHNADALSADFQHAASGRARAEAPPVHVVGPPGDVLIDPSACIDPLVVADTTNGPVIVDRGAVVTAFTRLEGPCYVGPHTHVLGAKIRAGTTLGPHCRIGGEVEASIVQGHSNKYHDGFLGHSYLGEWVNLGAGTSNSDLRNDYGEVQVTVAGRRVATGRSKVGCFIGDHTKTGLGTLINTGSNIGIFCNLLPAGRLAPKYVPSFASWWNGALCESFAWGDLLETAHKVMKRRDCALTDAHEALYRHIFAETAADRRRTLRDAEQRHLRRSA